MSLVATRIFRSLQQTRVHSRRRAVRYQVNDAPKADGTLVKAGPSGNSVAPKKWTHQIQEQL